MKTIDKQFVMQHLDIAAFYNQELPRLTQPKADDESTALCPFHEDHTPSLSVNIKTGLYYCHACGASGDVFSFVQSRYRLDFSSAVQRLAEIAGLPSLPSVDKKALPECPVDWDNPTHIFPYYNEDGRHAFDILRWEKAGYRKAIRHSRGLDRNGQRIRVKGDVQECPYNLFSKEKNRPHVINSNFIVIVEGENKAEALIAQGICASCNPGGAGKWRPEYSKYFENKEIVILPDNDSRGRAHAQQVATFLSPVAKLIKTLELPGLPDKGDIIDWLRIPENTIAMLCSLMQSAPPWKPAAPMERTKKRPLATDWKQFQGTAYLQTPLNSLNFLLQDTFLKNEIGVIAGLPGAGKGVFAMQMAVYMAVGLPVFECWQVPAATTVVYLSAEDGWQVLQHRLTRALAVLPEEMRQKAAENIYLVPVRGAVQLVESKPHTSIIETDNLQDLRSHIATIRPDLVFLDTLSRFFCIDENANATMTRACGALEEIAEEFGCNFIFLHHVNKSSGEFATNEKSLSTMLSQASIRGASSLAGAVRFAVVIAPLEKSFAAALLGNIHKGRPSGSIVGVKTVKKNEGPAEEHFFLHRAENGLLEKLTAEENKSFEIETKAQLLAKEVARRHVAAEKPLSRSRGACEILKIGTTQAEAVVRKAEEMGLITCVRNRKGHCLAPGKSPSSGEDN